MGFIILFIALLVGIDAHDNLENAKSMAEVPPKVWFEMAICLTLIIAGAIMMIFAGD